MGFISGRELAESFSKACGYPSGTLLKVKENKAAALQHKVLAFDVWVKPTMANRGKKIGSVVFNIGQIVGV